MDNPEILSASEQVARFLRKGLIKGGYTGLMPGVLKLERQLGVNRNTVEAALRQLEAEGLLKSQGKRRRRIITLKADQSSGSLNIGILLHDAGDKGKPYILKLQHDLASRGHMVTVTDKCLLDLDMDVKRVARLVRKKPMDAWIVSSGPEEVLEWFLSEKVPVYALFGRRRTLPIAGGGPDKTPAYKAAVRALILRGHRRIVLLCQPGRRFPEPGTTERSFLTELTKHGIPVSDYQLPDWDGHNDSLHHRLDILFRRHPPTSIIVDEVHVYAAALQFLCSKGIRVPEDVSLVCSDYDPWFDWLKPTVAHIRWEPRPMITHLLRWVGQVGRGTQRSKQIECPAEFVSGGTIGRVKQ